jgi:hypothetical protein
MYRVTVISPDGEEVCVFDTDEPLDFRDERGILAMWGKGHHLDIARIPINTSSDTFAFGNIDISQEIYE